MPDDVPVIWDSLVTGSSNLKTPSKRAYNSPLARLSQLGISWRLRGLFAVCLFGREFYGTVVYGTVVNARELPSYNYLVCCISSLASDSFFVVRGNPVVRLL